ncbi:hypothetical protein BGW39_002219 [Mortierella sp. 14UC]|nr:hypothetical protein BGW39_002219 [Mortierella sp. 14UC]
MTVRGQGRGEDNAGDHVADGEDGSTKPQPSINHRRRPTKPASSQPLVVATDPSEPAPLSWYATFTQNQSTSVIATPQPPTLAVPAPWTSTDSSQSTSPTSFPSSSLTRSFQPHRDSPPTRSVTPTASSNASRRHQSIPISFLIHPTSDPPQRRTSLSTLPPSLPASSSFSSKQLEQPTATRFSPQTIEEYDNEGSISATTHRACDYPWQSLRPSRSPSIDSAKFSSATTHVHVPTQSCWRPSEDEHLRHIEVPHLQQHGSVAFSDQSAPVIPPCPRSKAPLSVDNEKPQVEQKVESEIIQSDPEAIEEEASEEDTDGSSLLPKTPSVRRTSNPNLRTTKTGKIKHKSRKIGVSKKSTAYNRFLQQRSKALAEQFSDWTPQQRMKRIVEEWAVSEKNQHKTRRKSRFIGPDGELILPSLSASSASSAGAISSSVALPVTLPASPTAVINTTSSTKPPHDDIP